MPKSKVNKNFGKNVSVKVTKGDHEGAVGITMSDRPDGNGDYVIKQPDNSVIGVHANDLELVEDAKEDKGYTVSVGGREMGSVSDAVKALFGADGRPYIITEAKIKDDYCHYAFGIIRGVEAGAEHNVKIDNEITDDLRKAFERFNVHLAVIDDVFKHAGVEIKDIDSHHGDDLTMLYFVTGFKIMGEEGDESVVLTGSKHVSSAGGRIDIKTPKIPLDNTSSYQWYNELNTAVADARLQVSLYKEGKFIVPPPEEEKPNPKQLTIADAIEQNAEGSHPFIPGGFATMAPEESAEIDNEFEAAQV